MQHTTESTYILTALLSILFQVQIDPFGSNGPASWPILTEFRTDSISLVEESPKTKKQYCFGMYTQVVAAVPWFTLYKNFRNDYQ